MGRRSTELSTGCKENIITLLQQSKRFGEVERLLEIPKSTVFSVWKKNSIRENVENLTQKLTQKIH